MKRVTGLGGVFFRCTDPEKMKDWYRTHLGIESDKYGGMFTWRNPDDPGKTCITAWSPFPDSTEYFKPSDKQFMFNYRVENLRALLDELRKEGVTVVGEVEEFEYGKFGWIMDPEGNKIELWEPIDEPLLRAAGK
ncbi:MAG: glyoxalase [Bacteroidetes bacterium]|nr:glyoxalase [Bacteroidota bacterium]